jgi:hypothetical protein
VVADSTVAVVVVDSTVVVVDTGKAYVNCSKRAAAGFDALQPLSFD